MLGRLLKLVDVRGGEGKPAVLATIVLFAMVSGHMMLETARDALFLGKLDAARLPLVYAALAGLAVVAIYFSDRVVARAGRRNALIATLVLAIYGTVIFYMLPRSAPIIFALYLWSGLIGSVVVIQFWIFVGQLFTVGQAKRLFGLVAAGGALGALVGASTAAIVVRHAPVDILLVLGAGMFMISALVLTSFPSDPTAGQPDESRSFAGDEKVEKTAAEAFRRYPYLWRLGALIIIATIAVLVVDFMFKQSAARRLSPDELGGFFATWYAIFSGASLLFQLVGASWLLRRLGILSSLLVMPLLIAAGGAATVIVAGAMMATIATKGADGALRHSLHRVSTELLWMPLPSWARSRAKGLFDSGLTRGVQAATAAGLLALGSFGLDNSVILGGVVASLGAVWFVLALSMRRPYLELYRSGLARSSNNSALIDLNLKSLEVLVEALSSGDDNEVIAAMKLLAAKGRARLIPSLILYHSSPPVLREALRLVATADRSDWLPIAKKLLESDSDDVRTSALRAIARRGRLQELDDPGIDISPRVRAQLVFWRIQLSDTTEAVELAESVRDVLDGSGAGSSEAVRELLVSIAEDGDDRWAEVVMTCLEADDFEVANLAVEATTSLRDPRFLPLLISRLGKRDGRGAVREALVSIGGQALDALELAFRAVDTPSRVRLHLPRSVALFRTKRAAFVLLEQLNREPNGAVRFRILTMLSRMVVDIGITVPQAPAMGQLDRNLREYFRLLALQAPLERKTYEMPSEAIESAGLLHDLIADKMRQSLERCFLLLQITHPREDVAGIALAIESRDTRVRANALEFVDNMTSDLKRVDGSVDVRRLLSLALDNLPTEAKVSRAGDVVSHRPKTYDESILALAGDDDETTAAIAVYHALLLDVVHLRNDVSALVSKRPLLDPLGPELHEMLVGRQGRG